MFGTVTESPYDMQFSLAGIPVRISMWFWIMGAILGYGALRAGVPFLLAWLLVLLVSILVHEMGHALTARWFGYTPSILLYHFGGLAYYQPNRQHTRIKSIVITLAGPFAGFALYGLTRLFIAFGLSWLMQVPETFRPLISFILIQLLYINLWWGLVNLLPVLPLDGGRISQELCSAVSPFKGVLYAAWIGVIAAGLTAAWFVSQKDGYPAMMFALLAASNFSTIREWRSYRR